MRSEERWARIQAELDQRRDPWASSLGELSSEAGEELQRLLGRLRTLESLGPPDSSGANASARPRRRARQRAAWLAAAALLLALPLLWWGRSAPAPPSAPPPASLAGSAAPATRSHILDYRVELVVQRPGHRRMHVHEPARTQIHERRDEAFASGEELPPLALLATLSVERLARPFP